MNALWSLLSPVAAAVCSWLVLALTGRAFGGAPRKARREQPVPARISRQRDRRTT